MSTVIRSCLWSHRFKPDAELQCTLESKSWFSPSQVCRSSRDNQRSVWRGTQALCFACGWGCLLVLLSRLLHFSPQLIIQLASRSSRRPIWAKTLELRSETCLWWSAQETIYWCSSTFLKARGNAVCLLGNWITRQPLGLPTSSSSSHQLADAIEHHPRTFAQHLLVCILLALEQVHQLLHYCMSLHQRWISCGSQIEGEDIHRIQHSSWSRRIEPCEAGELYFALPCTSWVGIIASPQFPLSAETDWSASVDQSSQVTHVRRLTWRTLTIWAERSASSRDSWRSTCLQLSAFGSRWVAGAEVADH